MDKTKPLPQFDSEIKIANQFILLPNTCLGKGSFGQIYKGVNIKTKEEVALKIESNNIAVPQIMHESQILKSLQNGDGFPQVYLITKYEDTTIMAMELLGDNLENIMLQQPNKHFSLKTVLMIAIQLLKRIQFMHEQNLIHRDIKPENFTVGLKKKETTIYLIDYGLARRYYDKRTNSHIAYKEGKQITGTVRFASIYTHIGIEQSRRDDLEALGYMFVYFLKGDLPWQNLAGKNKKEKYQKIKEKKIECCPSGLCQGLDEEFAKYFKYVRELQFDETPDYCFLIELFAGLMKKHSMVNDLSFDWCRVLTNRKSNTNQGVNLCSAESLFTQLKMSYNIEKDNREKELGNNDDSNRNGEKVKDKCKANGNSKEKNVNENTTNSNNEPNRQQQISNERMENKSKEKVKQNEDIDINI